LIQTGILRGIAATRDKGLAMKNPVK